MIGRAPVVELDPDDRWGGMYHYVWNVGVHVVSTSSTADLRLPMSWALQGLTLVPHERIAETRRRRSAMSGVRHEGKESEGAQTPKGNCGGRIDRHSAICHGRHRERGGTDRHE
jgi:hypothetical protein